MATIKKIKDLAEMEVFAKDLLINLSDKAGAEATVLALSGDLGAGKTTLVQMLAKELGIEEVVTSPTFTIMKLYATKTELNFNKLVHIDAYRIESLDEVAPLHLDQIMQTKNTLVCIEWAEKIEAVLPKNKTTLKLSSLPDETREVIMTE